LQSSFIVANCEVITVGSHTGIITLLPHLHMSSHRFAVMSVISVSPVIFLACWVRYITVYKVWVKDRDGK